jgi:methyl coenzyme M reductase gamma subunit
MKDTWNQLEAVQYQRFRRKKKVPKISKSALISTTHRGIKTEAQRAHPPLELMQRPEAEMRQDECGVATTTELVVGGC